MSVIAVSSFSLHDMLGPLHLDVHDEDGNLTHLEIPKPALYSLEEFGMLASERLGVRAIELCQIQFADSSPERVAAREVTRAEYPERCFVTDAPKCCGRFAPSSLAASMSTGRRTSTRVSPCDRLGRPDD